MLRIATLLVILLSVSTAALAHFPFVVPEPGGRAAKVMFSETLEPEADVDVKLIGDAKLLLYVIDREPLQLKLTAGEQCYTIETPGTCTRVIRGVVDLGVMQRGKSPAHHLIYYPKTIIGDAFDSCTTGQVQVPVEIVPVKGEAGFKFRVISQGESTGKRTIRVITPDGAQNDYDLDGQGLSAEFIQPGRYGAWARHWIAKPSERAGKPFEQVRHYATLVVDVEPPSTGGASVPTASPLARLPEPVSSFGAIASDGWTYVYGGHIARVHTYSTEAVSGRFHRSRLDDGTTWESLPSGPGLQGMNLAAHGGKIYRVGGMQPRNKPDEKADNFSIADVVRFDPSKMAWETLPPLPDPRSSHDLAVVGDTLLVIGGWNMHGRGKQETWFDHLLELNLLSESAKWQPVAQPFQRRAMVTAVRNGKVYVIGGFEAANRPSLQVDVYNPIDRTWSRGPDLPGERRNGFAPAATSNETDLFVSVADGSLFRLNDGADAWEKIAETTPRIVHRLFATENEIFVVGGAAKGNNLDLIESVKLGNRSAGQ